MASTDTDLEQQLKEAGTKLVKPPSSVDELLPILDQVDSCLARVEQSPPESMQEALAPSLNSLIKDQLFRHSNVDVKVAVSSCISEITRITAPDAPYDDERMKEVFHLIVSSFENLDDKTSRSYVKRTSILETVAKVRSCVVMLDLECDALIVEMFKKFLKTVRDYHPEHVVSSMETIMILVLEESEDIPVELLSPLLVTIRKENEEVLPIARKLAEKVLESCASKIKPYLVDAVNYLQTSLDDYSDVVGSICQNVCVDGLKPGVNTKVEGSKTDGDLVGGAPKGNQEVLTAGDPSEVAAAGGPSEVAAATAGQKSSKSVVSNGVAKISEAKPLADSSSVKKPEGDAIEGTKDTSAAENADVNVSAVAKIAKKESKPVQRGKKRGRKPNSSAKVTKHAGSIQPADEKEAEKLPEETSLSKDAPSSPNVNQLVSDDVAVAPENKRKNDQAGDGESLTASPSVSGILEHGSLSEKVACENTKEGSIKEAVQDAPHASQPVPDDVPVASEMKRKNDDQAVDGKSLTASPSVSESLEDESLIKTVARLKKKNGSVKELVQSADNLRKKKASEGTSASEAKPTKRAGKKAPSVASKYDKSLKAAVSSKKESGFGSEEAPKQSSMVDDSSKNAEGSLLKQSDDKNQRVRGKAVSEKNVAKCSTKNDDNENISSLKSAVKPAKDENPVEETPKTNNKRKRVVGKSSEKGAASEGKVYGEDIVGSKVRVWWPQDRKFYEGKVHSYDSIKKKHKVIYDDDDEENLNMAKQKFEFIPDEAKSEPEGEATKPSSLDASSDEPEKKKAKSDQSTKQEKMDGSPIRGGEVSGKSKMVAGVKSGRKMKEPSKTDGKSADDSKTGKKKEVDDSDAKTKEPSLKSGGKSNDDASSKLPESEDADGSKVTKSKEEGASNAKSLKSKQETGKSGGKSARGRPRKRGGKSNANGTGKSKTVATKEKDTEEESSRESGKEEEEEIKKEKSVVVTATKGQGSGGAKRGRKRRRGA
ncbi:Sister chromatid cohesion protein PDS5 homolog C [Linum perenne]